MIKDYIHKEYPKTKDENDFWGQVSRTVHGKPVSQEQIDLIVNTIRTSLNISPNDVLLDIGCGNGALSQYLFQDLRQYHGIDFSEYLIFIAKKNFEKIPDFTFQNIDGASYVENEKSTNRFTKALIYGAFSYFSFGDAEKVLKLLHLRFLNIRTIFIGNLPDRDRAHLFYPQDKEYNDLLDDRNSPIGVWRSQSDFSRLAKNTGWKITFNIMPEQFYASHYRFDVILQR